MAVTVLLAEADGEQEITDRLAADPWATAGLLLVGAIEPWALWLDSRRGNSDLPGIGTQAAS